MTDLPAHTLDLLNNERVVITIKGKDPQGRFEKLPIEDEFTIENSDPDALSATIGTDHAGAPALILERRVVEAQEIRVDVSDKAGLTPVSLLVNIIPVASRGLDLDVANAATSEIGPLIVPSPATPTPTPEPEPEPEPVAQPQDPPVEHEPAPV